MHIKHVKCNTNYLYTYALLHVSENYFSVTDRLSAVEIDLGAERTIGNQFR